jgi:hypothetical protein
MAALRRRRSIGPVLLQLLLPLLLNRAAAGAATRLHRHPQQRHYRFVGAVAQQRRLAPHARGLGAGPNLKGLQRGRRRRQRKRADAGDWVGVGGWGFRLRAGCSCVTWCCRAEERMGEGRKSLRFRSGAQLASQLLCRRRAASRHSPGRGEQGQKGPWLMAAGAIQSKPRRAEQQPPPTFTATSSPLSTPR